jgi:hypothetical protein
VRLAAEARRETLRAGVAALIEEIFTGRPVRPLPNCVADALDMLSTRPATITATNGLQRA